MSVTIRKGINSTVSSRTGVGSTTPMATSPGKEMGTYHLANNPNMFEIQRSNNFEFIISDIDGIMRAGMEGTEGKNVRNISNAQEIVRLSVTRASVPHFSQSPIEVRRGNSVIKYAGVPSFDSGSLEVNDYIGANARDVLLAWQALSYNVKTEKVGLASQYKKDCYLVEYSPDYQVVRQWRLHGCWISGLSEGDFSAEDNSKKTVSATIQYDRAEIDYSGLVE